MQRLGMSWLVYRLTGSTTWLGTIVFFSWFSAFLLLPTTGVILDSGARQRILKYSQLLGFVQAMALAYLTWTEMINIPWLIVMSLLLGLVNSFDMPGRHSFVSDIVTDRKLLTNAIATNSLAYNLARLAGPAVAGFIVARYGEALCFFINGLSFLPFAWALFTIKLTEKPKEPKTREPFFKKISDGFSYAAQHEIILPVLGLLASASFMGMPIQMVLFPVIAAQTLGGGAVTLGYLSAAVGLGAVIGAIALAKRQNTEGLEQLPPRAFGMFGIMAAGIAFSRFLPLSLFFATMMGACIVFGWSACNTILQTTSTKEKRSRVMSIYMMCFSGSSPIGSFFLGWFATQTNPETAIILGACSCITAAFIYLRKVNKIPANKLVELFNTN